MDLFGRRRRRETELLTQRQKEMRAEHVIEKRDLLEGLAKAKGEALAHEARARALEDKARRGRRRRWIFRGLGIICPIVAPLVGDAAEWLGDVLGMDEIKEVLETTAEWTVNATALASVAASLDWEEFPQLVLRIKLAVELVKKYSHETTGSLAQKFQVDDLQAIERELAAAAIQLV